MADQPHPTVGEEISNAISHGVGVLASAAALVLLLVYSSLYGNVYHIVSAAVYGFSLLMLYINSTLYHSLQNPKAKSLFRILDHSSIYFLIAGTYTPFTLIALKGGWGWSLFGIVWGLALCGTVFKVFFVNRFAVLSLSLYILMGWLIVIAAIPLFEAVPRGGLILLALGGLCYTGGIYFYTRKQMKYAHMIWHLFVLGGSAFHFFSVFFYLIPDKP